MQKYLNPVFIAIVLLTSSCAFKGERADLVVHNARIYSMDEQNSTFEAMAVKDGKILELGPNRQILNKYSADKKVDAVAKPVYPGFIDAHCHFLYYGLGLNEVQLENTSSFREVLEKLDKYADDFSGEWIIGRGWDQNKWEDNNFPDKNELDEMFPETPVVLTRVDGHALLANQAAIEKAGVDLNSEIAGGIIEKQNGELTGIFIDNAMATIQNAIPEKSRQQKVEALLTAQKNCFKVGLTTVDDAGLMWDEVQIVDSLQKAGELKMKIYAMLSDHPENFERYLDEGPYKTDRLNVRSFKFYADGALGSRGACLLEPYSDVHDSAHYGMILSEPEYFQQRAGELHEAGFQMNTHCIGDSSVQMLLNTYAGALGGVNDKRWRIEHAQVVAESDIEKFREYAIVPSVQPTHATSDMHWADERLGEERLKNAYAYQDLKNQLGWLTLGTDFPVEDISPFETFQSAVFRQNEKGEPEDGFQTENALERIEAIKGMTIWAALSNFEESEKGSLVKGKVADFIILSHDLMSVPEDEVLDTEVLKTFSNGELVYSKP